MWFSQSEVVLHSNLKRSWRKRQRMFLRMVGEYNGPKSCTVETFTRLGRLINTLLHNHGTLKKKPFENIVRKRENAGNQHFLLFPQCFLSFQKQISIIQSHWISCLQMLSNWISLQVCRLVKSNLDCRSWGRLYKYTNQILPLWSL